MDHISLGRAHRRAPLEACCAALQATIPDATRAEGRSYTRESSSALRLSAHPRQNVELEA